MLCVCLSFIFSVLFSFDVVRTVILSKFLLRCDCPRPPPTPPAVAAASLPRRAVAIETNAPRSACQVALAVAGGGMAARVGTAIAVGGAPRSSIRPNEGAAHAVRGRDGAGGAATRAGMEVE